jgi:GMP synthase-like glutamine amidotransferase
MKLGILNATTPADEALFQMSEMGSFQNFFAQVPHQLTLIEYRITEGDFPATVTACDAYLVTGSPQGVYDQEPWIGALADFLRRSYTAGQKLVGICFGHQMLAHTLGGHAEKAAGGWGMGLHRFVINATPGWMTPTLTQGQLYFCHQDQVMRLPANAQRLAGNAFCPNAIFVIGDQVLGIQGHPEFSTAFMALLIDALGEQAGATVAAQAAASLQAGAPDGAIVAQWVVNFLQQ